MLPPSSQPSSSSDISAAERIHETHNHTSNPWRGGTYMPPDEDENGENGNGEFDLHREQNATGEGGNLYDLLQSRKLDELLRIFFIRSHQKLFILQDEIRNAGESDNPFLWSVKTNNTRNLHKLRVHYYRMQVFLLNMRKGATCDLIH